MHRWAALGQRALPASVRQVEAQNFSIRKHLLEAIAAGNGRKDWAALAEFLGAKGSG